MCYNHECQSLDRVSVAFILSKNAADRTTLLVYKKVLSEDVHFFLIYEGKEGSNTTKSGPSSTHEQNAIHMAFRWRTDAGPTLNAGLVRVAL